MRSSTGSPGAEECDPGAIRALELGRLIVHHAIEPERIDDERLGRGVGTGGPAHVDQRRRRGEGEQTAASQDAGRLRHPGIGVGEARGTPIAEGDVGRGIGQRQSLRRCVDEPDGNAGLTRSGPGGAQLCLGQVDADGGRAGPREGDRPLCRAAAELDRGQAGDIAEDAELRFGDLPDAPCRPACLAQLPTLHRLVALAVSIPPGAVAGGVIRQRCLEPEPRLAVGVGLARHRLVGHGVVLRPLVGAGHGVSDGA